MRYYLEMVEDGHRMPTGKGIGYDTLAEAKEAARLKVDDALPQNTVRILAHVATAYMGGYGGQYVREEQ